MTPPAAGAEPLDLAWTAVGSGREVRLGSLTAPVLLICFGQETQAGIQPVEDVARSAYPKHSDLVVAHVIDLHKIPSLLRKVAEGVLAGEHRKAVEALPAGVPAADYVVILPDWDGSSIRALGLDDATKTLGLALCDAGGRVIWRHQGDNPAGALAERLSGEAPLQALGPVL